MTSQEFEEIDFNDLVTLGEGSWTTAYKFDNETVLLKSDCKVKEVISQGLLPKSPLFPEIEKVFYDEYDKMSYYTMDLLEIGIYGKKNDFRSELDEKSKKVWDHLIKFEDNFSDNYYDFKHKMTRLEFWIKAFTKTLSKALSKLMITALQACDIENTGNVWFDMPMHNVGHKNGQLVLFDCFCNFGKDGP